MWLAPLVCIRYYLRRHAGISLARINIFHTALPFFSYEVNICGYQLRQTRLSMVPLYTRLSHRNTRPSRDKAIKSLVGYIPLSQDYQGTALRGDVLGCALSFAGPLTVSIEAVAFVDDAARVAHQLILGDPAGLGGIPHHVARAREREHAARHLRVEVRE